MDVPTTGRDEVCVRFAHAEDMNELALVFGPFHDAIGYRFDKRLLRTLEIEPSEGEGGQPPAETHRGKECAHRQEASRRGCGPLTPASARSPRYGWANPARWP